MTTALVPWSWKGRAITLLPLWIVRPVQSLSACTKVHFTVYMVAKTHADYLYIKILLKLVTPDYVIEKDDNYCLIVVTSRSTSLCNNRICTPSLTAKLHLFCNRGHQYSPLAPSLQAHTICGTNTNNFLSSPSQNFYKCFPAWLEYRISVSVRVVFW